MPNKTQPTHTSVAEFLAQLDNEVRRADSEKLVALMQEESGEEPVLWGTAIVGFGQYHYRYQSGREGDFMRVGFSPRKDSLSIYIIPGFESYASLLARLGKHKLGRGCLYIKRLADVDLAVLKELVRQSLADMQRMYPAHG